MTLPAGVRARLRPLVLRLAGEQPGEVVAAAAAIGRVLKSAGLSWHALADAIAPPAPGAADPVASAPPSPGDGPTAVAAMIDATLRRPERLSRGEVAFLFVAATRVRTGGRLSADQERVLRRLHRRVGAGAAA